LLKARTDARLVISPWSDHSLESFDPGLVNAAVEAATALVHKIPPPPPSAWRWRIIGAMLSMLAAGKLASCLMDLFPQLARFRGMFIGIFIVAAFILTLGGRLINATPHFRLQGIAMAIIMGGTVFQAMGPPRTAPEALKPQVAINLDAKLLDACVGQYEFPPDNRILVGVKRTIWREGDHLRGETTVMNKSYETFEVYPESERIFSSRPLRPCGRELTLRRRAATVRKDLPS
jgi:hypothetical protein